MSLFKSVLRRLRGLAGGSSDAANPASGDDTLRYIRQDDPAMTAAWSKARGSAETFIQLLSDPALEDADFYVKKCFDDGQRSEHIWLNDVSYHDGVFVGYVGNEPGAVTGVEYDQEARVATDEISDWMVMRGNEILHGGWTVELLMRQRGEGST